ncbi:1-phosphofructokinase family hexose kinase [Jiangella sp. DSM 45060]|uniref:1-phosphofructokinase family hexose kinase n=1 Tax=Jiangella sp. DSM 45060 TaxID=1798224 RepID=UPI00087C9A2A|nr:PfkB family carbohydrate kinase [Jiangella sp. DSM 45060]SDT72903.1 1-phosphofructokinase [Jiangella sp. DSM 45060]
MTHSDVALFAPSPVLTLTIEDQAGRPDIHVHAGGQGVWQARMLVTLGVSVTMCCVLAGETGTVLRHLIEDEGVTVKAVEGAGRNGAYIHDRRGGERVEVAEAPSDPLTRHDLDELYGLTLSAALDAGAVLLSGPSDHPAAGDALPADAYRRLAADLRAVGKPVVADLAGDRLAAVLESGLTVVKVSHEELLADGRAASDDQEALVRAMHDVHDQGARYVIVTRADDPLLVLADDVVRIVRMPRLQSADTHGAGDSLTAGVTATLARGGGIEDAVRLGAAAGMLNVTRHGLGTGDAEAVVKLRDLVEVERLAPGGHAATAPQAKVTPRDLAERTRDS